MTNTAIQQDKSSLLQQGIRNLVQAAFPLVAQCTWQFTSVDLINGFANGDGSMTTALLAMTTIAVVKPNRGRGLLYVVITKVATAKRWASSRTDMLLCQDAATRAISAPSARTRISSPWLCRSNTTPKRPAHPGSLGHAYLAQTTVDQDQVRHHLTLVTQSERCPPPRAWPKIVIPGLIAIALFYTGDTILIGTPSAK